MALVATVVLAAVALPDPVRTSGDRVSTEQAASLVPSAAPGGALSAAWFCGGGSALGRGGPAELVLVVANVATKPASATITVVGDEGERAQRRVRVPARNSVRVSAARLGSARWVAATVEVLGGQAVVSREVSGADGFDAAPCSSAAADVWHVASGATVRGATELLSIYNPFPDAASVDVTLATESGPRQPRALRGLSIAGGAVRVVRVNDTVTNRERVAATVRVRFGRVVVDRIQRYDGTGDPVAVASPGATAPDDTTPPDPDGTTPDDGSGVTVAVAPKGLVSAPATPGTAGRWLFPGTDPDDAIAGQVAVYNPSEEPAEVDIVLSYEEPGRNSTVEPIQLTVRPGQQRTVDLADAAGLESGIAFTVDVRSLQGVGVVAELLGSAVAPATSPGAAVALGAPVAATRWLVADVSDTPTAAISVTVANPGRTAARLTVTDVHDGDERRLRAASIVVPAGDRRTLRLSQARPGSALAIDADHAVVVTTGFDLLRGLGRSTALAQPAPATVEALPPAP